MKTQFSTLFAEFETMSPEEIQAMKTQLDNRLGKLNYADVSKTQQDAVAKQTELTNKAERAYTAKKFGESYDINDLRLQLVEA